MSPEELAIVQAVEAEKPDPAQIAEGRRRVCLTTAVTMVMHSLLLPWEAADYAKYMEDYLREGIVPRDEVLDAKAPKPERKVH